MRKILVAAAHPDDEILGVGGTLKKHIQNGDEVYCIILGEGVTSRSANREGADLDKLNKLHQDSMKVSKIMGFKEIKFLNLPDNRFDSVDLLDIVKKIEECVEIIKPEIVYTHHYGDLNIDHRKTFEAVMTAARPIGEYSIKEIYTFETLSSTEWNYQNSQNAFKPTVFIEINETLTCKLEAMSCYETELRDYPHPRSLKSIEIAALKWGTVINEKYCEAFELVRKIVK